MDPIEHNPSGTHSFLVNNDQGEAIDLSKKRKLLDKQLSLPIRKLKFRDGSSGCADSFPFVRVSEAEAVQQICIRKGNDNPLHHDSKLTQEESKMDNNSFVEESGCGTFQCIESKPAPEFPMVSQCIESKPAPEFPMVSTHEQPPKSKLDFTEVYAGDKPFTSSGGYVNNSFKDVVYSLDSRNLKKLHIEREKAIHLVEFGYDIDYDCSADYETGKNEEFMDDESEDPMLYSNVTSSDLFMLSLGRWPIKPDAQAGMREPTIDQEFEEYFSSLMM